MTSSGGEGTTAAAGDVEPGAPVGASTPARTAPGGSIFPAALLRSILPRTDGAIVLAIFTDFVTNEIVQYGYLAIFVLMLLESACIPIPSEVTMLFGGALASAGFVAAGQELDLFWVVMAGTGGNVVGSWIAYWAGAVGGRPLVDRFGRYLLVRPHEVDRAHAWFERHGDVTVFVSRLLPVVRTFISVPAGVARMNVVKFTIYTVLGCLPWTFALAWIGYILGDNWEAAEKVIQPIAWAIAVVIAVGGVWWVVRRWRQVREEYAALDRARSSEHSEP
jgi:membrane protein DedA with SNARE-associated domain